MLIRCLLLSIWRKSRPAQFFPSPSTKYNWCWKIEVGKNWPGGEKTDRFFFLPGKKMTSQFLPRGEMGRPDPSPGKDWRGKKTDRYTGAGADRPQGIKFWCQQKCLITSFICCKFQKISLKSDFIHFFLWFYTHVYSPKAGADNPLGMKFLCQQEHLVTLVICCKFLKKSLWSLILYNFFHDFRHVYTPRAGADSPQGTKFWHQQKGLITLLICCKFQRNLFEVWFYTIFFMI